MLNRFLHNNFFFKHLNNYEMDETNPYSIIGTDNSRIFKDKSTDSFVKIIFDSNE